MIKDLDLTLESLLSGEAEPGSELAAAKISFAPPDEEWSRRGNSLELNVYLYDMRENLELRSNEEYRERNPDGTITRKKAPPRVNCSFLITAWNKANMHSMEDNIFQEHRLLSQVLEILLKNPKVPSDYLRGSLQGQQPDLPLVIAQKGGVPDPVEFWSSLGSPLRPSINCVITLSLDLKQWITSPMAVTQVTEYRRRGEDDVSRVVRIGGRVSGTGDPGPGLDNAVVKLDALKKMCRTDSMGYYMLSNIPAGDYDFVAESDGYVTKEVNMTLPAPAGENYDIVLLQICQINGRILDDWDTNRGVASATVTIVELQKETTTDADGNYSFADIVEGDYTFSVTAPKYLALETAMHVPPAEADGYDILISELHDVVGRVVNRKRPWQGIANASVTFTQLSRSGTTDAEGYYSIPEILRGRYHVQLRDGNHRHDYTFDVPVDEGGNYDIWH